DFFAVYDAAGKAIERARDGGGPTLIECKVARYFGHYEGDTQAYRGPEEVKAIRANRDCIDRVAQAIIQAGAADFAGLAAIDSEVKARINDAIVYAQLAPKPQAADLLTDVYVAY